MPVDHIRYDILAQAALRGVVRTVLGDAAKKGLPGEHHFKITFSTTAPGVRLSERLRQQYPEAMTIILQHQFWDLLVNDDGFEVGLSFGGVPERLAVPYAAITAFYDPAVQFGFQFETVPAETVDESKPAPKTTEQPARLGNTRRLAAQPAKAEALPVPETPPPAPAAGPSGEVVRLDRFRKK